MVKIYKYSTVYNSEIVLDADDLKEATIEQLATHSWKIAAVLQFTINCE